MQLIASVRRLALGRAAGTDFTQGAESATLDAQREGQTVEYHVKREQQPVEPAGVADQGISDTRQQDQRRRNNVKIGEFLAQLEIAAVRREQCGGEFAPASVTQLAVVIAAAIKGIATSASAK